MNWNQFYMYFPFVVGIIVSLVFGNDSEKIFRQGVVLLLSFIGIMLTHIYFKL